MLAITAVIRVKKGFEQRMLDELRAVVDNARLNEPGTVGYFVAQGLEDAAVFTTYERYADQAAMDRHNNSPTVARFFDAAKPMLDGPVTVVTTQEMASKV